MLFRESVIALEIRGEFKKFELPEDFAPVDVGVGGAFSARPFTAETRVRFP
jgi:hypothetical protein